MEMERQLVVGTETAIRLKEGATAVIKIADPQPPQDARTMGSYAHAEEPPCFYISPQEVGDIVYVKEPFAYVDGRIVYQADGPIGGAKWKPAHMMHRQESRRTCIVKRITIKKINDINGQEAQLLGYQDIDALKTAWPRFIRQLLKTWVPRGINIRWPGNPWVWIYELESK